MRVFSPGFSTMLPVPSASKGFQFMPPNFQPRGPEVLSAPKGRDIQPRASAAASAAKRRPGVVVRQGEALKGRHKRLLTTDGCLGHVTIVSPFQGFQFMPPNTQGDASLALG